jgi:hypothetical protein
VTFPVTLPRAEWAWAPDGKRIRVWIWPQGHLSEMDIDVSNLAPSRMGAECSDQHTVKFTAVPMPNVTASSKLDECVLDALLLQCDCATETIPRRGGR